MFLSNSPFDLGSSNNSPMCGRTSSSRRSASGKMCTFAWSNQRRECQTFALVWWGLARCLKVSEIRCNGRPFSDENPQSDKVVMEVNHFAVERVPKPVVPCFPYFGDCSLKINCPCRRAPIFGGCSLKINCPCRRAPIFGPIQRSVIQEPWLGWPEASFVTHQHPKSHWPV